MLKKFRTKGEYLYVGLFVISSFAISYNPIQQYISDRSKIETEVVSTELKDEDKSLLKSNISFRLKDSFFDFKDNLLSSLSKKELPILDKSNDKYKYLNLDSIFKNKEYHSMFFENKKANLNQARKLADFISSTYKIDLPTAETIVLNTYNEAIKNNLDPLLILSIIEGESSYQKNSVSVVGAVGLTQVFPIYHGKKIENLKKHNLDIFSIKGNVMVGTLIIREYIDLYNGNITKALQKYNGSSSDETLKYSNKIFAFKDRLEKVAKT